MFYMALQIKRSPMEERALIQLRNEIAYHLSLSPKMLENSDNKDNNGRENTMGTNSEVPKLPDLPEPLNSERMCAKCSQLLVCTALQKEENSGKPVNKAMEVLIPQAVGHLSQKCLNFFHRWCVILHLELAESRTGAVRALWCQDPEKREEKGSCLSFLKLSKAELVGINSWKHEFIRPGKKFPMTSLSLNDMVVVSTNSSIALSQGFIVSFTDSKVEILLDRKLASLSCNYHADACHYQSAVSRNFTGLATLMQDNPRAASLRRLIIDGVLGVAKAGLSRQLVESVRPLLKRLNKEQQRAVLRCVMSSDYTLIHGFPGTGKSVCVVSLVQVLVKLGQSVFITSYTHSALDNILLRLKPLGVDFLRLGRNSRIHPDLLEYSDETLTKNITKINDLSEFYSSKLVVASTCLGVNHPLFNKRLFDVCIVDEAAQVLLPSCLPPLSYASKFVLVGDSKQLPPIMQSKQAIQLGGCESVFSILEKHNVIPDYHSQNKVNMDSKVESDEKVSSIKVDEKISNTTGDDKVVGKNESNEISSGNKIDADSKNKRIDRTQSSENVRKHHGNSVQLTLQYRMNAPIMRLANLLTYEGQLRCATPEVEGARLALDHQVCF